MPLYEVIGEGLKRRRLASLLWACTSVLICRVDEGNSVVRQVAPPVGLAVHRGPPGQSSCRSRLSPTRSAPRMVKLLRRMTTVVNVDCRMATKAR